MIGEQEVLRLIYQKMAGMIHMLVKFVITILAEILL